MSAKLSNSTIIKAHQASLKASAAIQTYVETILKQPDLLLKEMPTLPEHQKIARNHASKWILQITPNMVVTNAGIIDFSNAFNAYYNDLIALADKVANDPEARKNFILGLAALRNDIRRMQSQVKQEEFDLKSFQTNLNKDYEIFQADAKAANAIYVGADGKLADLQGQIDSLQKKMNTFIGLMAGGAVGILAGIVMICVGVFAEIATAGISTGLVLGGIGVLTTGISSEISGGAEYGIAVNELADLKEQLAEDKQGLLVIGVEKGKLDGMVDQIAASVTATGTLLQSWNDLDASFGKVIKDIETDPGKYGPQLKAMLDFAKQDWGDALSLAEKMQPDGKLPVKDFKKIQDAIKHG